MIAQQTVAVVRERADADREFAGRGRLGAVPGEGFMAFGWDWDPADPFRLGLLGVDQEVDYQKHF